MMGTKKLKEVRKELVDAFAKAGIDEAWFDRELAGLSDAKKRDVETLVLFRDALARLTTKPKRKAGRKPTQAR